MRDIRPPGFTLIELLLVVGIIGILAAIVIVAINPTRQLAQTRNVQRRSDVKTILEALQQYAVDHTGNLPSGIDSVWRIVGTEEAGCDRTCGGSTSAQQIILYPSADSYLNQAASGTNYGSAVEIQEYPWAPSWTRRGIIRFDLSNIPSSALVTSALQYLREKQAYGVGTQNVAIHRVTDNWAENTVTWSDTAADFVSSATDTIAMQWTGSHKWDSWNVLADVQNFVSGAQPNYGWIIKDAVEDSSQAYWYFHSREETDPADYRPYLLVEYSSSGDDGGTTASECLDLSGSLVTQYLPNLPADPSAGSGARTQYAVRSSGYRVMVRACGAELGENISVMR